MAWSRLALPANSAMLEAAVTSNSTRAESHINGRLIRSRKSTGTPRKITASITPITNITPVNAGGAFNATGGTVVFAGEPLVRVRGKLIQAQLVETALLTLINFPTLVATNAARVVLAAGGDSVLEFGLRRAQGPDGGLSASRAAYLGGCEATSNVLAGRLFGIPVRGTHAHSWILSFSDEQEAMDTWAEVQPQNTVLLVDTFDTLDVVDGAAVGGGDGASVAGFTHQVEGLTAHVGRQRLRRLGRQPRVVTAVVRVLGERIGVSADAERRRRAGHHDGSDRRICVRALEGIVQAVDHGRAERVPILDSIRHAIGNGAELDSIVAEDFGMIPV